MIQKIGIKNFKSVVDLTLELGQVNVFIGENGCGKTNILEAIAFAAGFGSSTKIKMGDSDANVRGVRLTETAKMLPRFQNNAAEEAVLTFFAEDATAIQIQATPINENEWLSISADPKDMELLNAQLGNIESEGEIGYQKIYRFLSENETFSRFFTNIFIDLKGKQSPLQETIRHFAIFCPENYFLRRFEEEGQLRPLGIRGEGLFKHLVDLYKKDPEILVKIGKKLRLIGWFEGFEIPKDLMFTEKRINIKDKYLQELDFFDQRSANEGFLYLLFYFTLFISPDSPSFFAIDNIDNALNPKLGAELIRQISVLCKENNKQALLTTHNPAILDGLDLEDEQQRLFTVYRNIDGHTVARRVMPPKKIEGTESVRLSEAFIRGYLGGLPKNF